MSRDIQNLARQLGLSVPSYRLKLARSALLCSAPVEMHPYRYGLRRLADRTVHFPAGYANQLCYEAVNHGSVFNAVVSAIGILLWNMEAYDLICKQAFIVLSSLLIPKVNSASPFLSFHAAT